MKKVILIGDSIRMGYDKYIKAALEDTAEVYYPGENCRFATYVLRFVHEWKKKGEWPEDADLVHWNAGLWDLPEILGDEPVTPIEAYASTIARIDKRLRLLFPKAKIVFATSTAVQEEKYGPDFKRTNKSIEEYNAIARSVLEPLGEEIDDLYAVSLQATEAHHSDLTHYNTDAGRLLLGGAVVRCLCAACDIPEDAVNYGAFSVENYTASQIGQ